VCSRTYYPSDHHRTLSLLQQRLMVMPLTKQQWDDTLSLAPGYILFCCFSCTSALHTLDSARLSIPLHCRGAPPADSRMQHAAAHT